MADEWTLESTRILGGARYDCAYACLDNDRHFFIGGQDDDGQHAGTAVESTVVEYNCTLQNFTSHTPLPETKRYAGAAATALDEHSFLIAGGYDGSARVYDSRRKNWETHWPDLNLARCWLCCVCTSNKVYAIGGHDGSHLDSIEQLDLSIPTPSWTILPQRLKTKRSRGCAVVDPKNPNNIIVVGGLNLEDGCLSSCEVVSLEEGQTRARTLPSLSTPRARHTLVLVENRFLVAMGGGNDSVPYLSSVEVLDLDEEEQQEWRPLPSMQTPRAEFAAFYSSRNREIVVAGGFCDCNTKLDTVEGLQVHFPWQTLQMPPAPIKPFPAGTMDSDHQRSIERWLEAMEEDMAECVAAIDARDKEVARERQDYRRICHDYVAHVNAQQEQARAMFPSGLIQDASNLTSSSLPDADISSLQNLRKPHRLTKIPSGHMDGTHKREIEQWIEESERCKNAYVAAVDRRETELEKEVDANRQARDDYVAEVERLQECGRGIWEILENPDNTELGSSDTPQESGLKPAFEYEEGGSFDGSVHSIPSRGEDATE